MTAAGVTPPAIARAWLLAAVLGTALNLRSAVTSVGALLPEIQADLTMSATQAGILTSLPVVSFGVIALIANRISRRLGLVRALTLSTAAIAVGLVVRVLVPATSWLLVTSLIVLSGIAVGNVLVPVAVRSWFPDRVGPTTGWYAIALSVGTGLPAAVAVPVAASLGGWRPGLAVWAVPAAIALVPWLVLRRAGARDRAGGEDPSGAGSPATVGGGEVAAAGPVPVDRPKVHRRLQAWALGVYFGLQGLEAYVAMGWLPSILRDAGVAPEVAGGMVGVAMVVGAPVALLLPRLAGRGEDQRVFVVGLAALSGAAYLGLLLAPAARPLLWTVLLGFGLGAFPLALLLIGVRTATPAGTAALSALAQGSGYLLAAAGPVTVGLLRDLTGGWAAPLLLLLGLLVPKLIAGLLAAAPGHVDLPRPHPGGTPA